MNAQNFNFAQFLNRLFSAQNSWHFEQKIFRQAKFREQYLLPLTHARTRSRAEQPAHLDVSALMLNVPLSSACFVSPAAVCKPSSTHRSQTRCHGLTHDQPLLNPPKIRHYHVANVTRWRLHSDVNAEQQQIERKTHTGRSYWSHTDVNRSSSLSSSSSCAIFCFRKMLCLLCMRFFLLKNFIDKQTQTSANAAHRAVFFNLFAAAKPYEKMAITYGTPCNDPWVQRRRRSGSFRVSGPWGRCPKQNQ